MTPGLSGVLTLSSRGLTSGAGLRFDLLLIYLVALGGFVIAVKKINIIDIKVNLTISVF